MACTVSILHLFGIVSPLNIILKGGKHSRLAVLCGIAPVKAYYFSGLRLE